MSLLQEVDKASPPPAARRGRRPAPGQLTRTAALGLGVGVLWLSIIVLLPIAAILAKSLEGGLGQFWANVTDPEALATIRLTVGASLLVTLVNAVIGTLIAWVLVRDSFHGKAVIEVIIDIPFALPTIVAG